MTKTLMTALALALSATVVSGTPADAKGDGPKQRAELKAELKKARAAKGGDTGPSLFERLFGSEESSTAQAEPTRKN